MVQLTPKAAVAILNAAMASQADGLGLRLAARQNDGEIEYGMGFDEERDGDEVLEAEGLRLYIGPGSQQLLAGVVLDFVEFENGEHQFVFMRPDQPGGCSAGGCQGCGAKH